MNDEQAYAKGRQLAEFHLAICEPKDLRDSQIRGRSEAFENGYFDRVAEACKPGERS